MMTMFDLSPAYGCSHALHSSPRRPAWLEPLLFRLRSSLVPGHPCPTSVALRHTHTDTHRHTHTHTHTHTYTLHRPVGRRTRKRAASSAPNLDMTPYRQFSTDTADLVCAVVRPSHRWSHRLHVPNVTKSQRGHNTKTYRASHPLSPWIDESSFLGLMSHRSLD